MKKPAPALAITVTASFMAGCVATAARPLPEPAMRPATHIAGVVLGDTATGERIVYSELLQVEWTDSTVVLTGSIDDGSRGEAPIATTPYRLADVGGVLVREVDANRTSLLIAGVVVGVSAVATLLFTGKTGSGTLLGPTGG